jgi:hypothetical protein
VLLRCEPPGHLEPVEIRKLDIKQHQIRPYQQSRPCRLGAIRRLGHREPGSLEHLPGKPSEAIMVIHDEYRC